MPSAAAAASRAPPACANSAAKRCWRGCCVPGAAPLPSAGDAADRLLPSSSEPKGLEKLPRRPPGVADSPCLTAGGNPGSKHKPGGHLCTLVNAASVLSGQHLQAVQHAWDKSVFQAQRACQAKRCCHAHQTAASAGPAAASLARAGTAGTWGSAAAAGRGHVAHAWSGGVQNVLPGECR